MTIEVQYELECLPEDLNYRDEMDEDNANWIEEQLDHNEWAWFCAKVVAFVEIKGERFEGSITSEAVATRAAPPSR